MTISLAGDCEVQQILEALEDLKRVADQIPPSGEVERKGKVIPVTMEGYALYMRKVMEEYDRRCKDIFEKVRMLAELAQAEIQRVTKHMLHRTQGRTSSNGKTSAKKSASSSGGNGGGDGGGDGDGPHRARPQQKRRSRKNRNTHSQHPPSFPPGAISSTSSQPPPPSQRQGLAPLLLILCIFVIVLIATGERDMAQYVLGSMAIPGLFERLKNPPRNKR